MELRQLRYLLAVADAGSFTAAARRSFVTQPTLSTAIAQLEAELGVTLFVRNARGATLTEAGRRAAGHARTALRAAEALRADSSSGRTAPPVRIGVLPTIAYDVVLHAVGFVQDRLGGQPVRLDQADHASLRRRLTAGRLDVAVTNLQGIPTGLEQHEIATDTMCLAYPKGGAPSDTVTPEALDRAPTIVRTHCELLSAASRILDERHIRPWVSARVHDDTLALALVATGHGACLIPDSHTHDRVDIVSVDGIDLRRRIGLEWRTNAHPEFDHCLPTPKHQRK